MIKNSLLQLTQEEFIAKLASSEPAPGGGSASAQAAANGAALLEMVANLTLGRKRYEGVAAEMEELRIKAQSLRQKAMALIDEDTLAYELVMAAFKLPKESQEEKSIRNKEILKSTRIAIETPKATALLALEVIKLSFLAMTKGNQNTFSDGLVAAYLASAGCKGALANVKINLSGLRDQEEIDAYVNFCTETAKECDRLLMDAEIHGKTQLG